MESRRQCPASSGSLTAHSSSSSLLCRAFWGEPPWDPADTNPALVSASRISPCQVKELEVLGGSELLLQPLLGCGALLPALLRAQPPQPPWLLCSPKSAPGVSVHLKTEKVFFKRMRRVRKTSNFQSPESDGCTDNTALFSFGMLGMFCTAVSHKPNL